MSGASKPMSGCGRSRTRSDAIAVCVIEITSSRGADKVRREIEGLRRLAQQQATTINAATSAQQKQVRAAELTAQHWGLASRHIMAAQSGVKAFDASQTKAAGGAKDTAASWNSGNPRNQGCSASGGWALTATTSRRTPGSIDQVHGRDRHGRHRARGECNRVARRPRRRGPDGGGQHAGGNQGPARLREGAANGRSRRRKRSNGPLAGRRAWDAMAHHAGRQRKGARPDQARERSVAGSRRQRSDLAGQGQRGSEKGYHPLPGTLPSDESLER